MSPASISIDSRGKPMLLLRGEWDSGSETSLARNDWDVLTLFHVDWPNYTPLLPYTSKISHLRVPFGPDSSLGLSELHDLASLEVTDALSPPVDFRLLRKLRYLETFWNKGPSSFMSNASIELLKLHKAGGPDLSWIPHGSRLRALELIGGSLKSLSGLQSACELEELRALELRACTDISSVLGLSALRVLEVDTPKATLESVDWVASMPSLNRLMLTAPAGEVNWRAIGAHPSLQSAAVTVVKGYGVTDEHIERDVRAGGREFLGIKRYVGKRTTIAIDLGS